MVAQSLSEFVANLHSNNSIGMPSNRHTEVEIFFRLLILYLAFILIPVSNLFLRLYDSKFKSKKVLCVFVPFFDITESLLFFHHSVEIRFLWLGARGRSHSCSESGMGSGGGPRTPSGSARRSATSPPSSTARVAHPTPSSMIPISPLGSHFPILPNLFHFPPPPAHKILNG